MTWKPQDTIAWRFGLTIAAALVATCIMICLFYVFGGVWARPPIDAAARLEGASAIVQTFEAAPMEVRPKLAAAINTKIYHAAWYAQDTSVSQWFDRHRHDNPNAATRAIEEYSEELLQHAAITITPKDLIYYSSDFPIDTKKQSETYYFAVMLKDHSWLIFTGYGRYWGLSQSQRLGVWLIFLLLAVVCVSIFTTRLISRPIKQFANAVRLRSIDLQAFQIKETGPQELREVVVAFNEMQLKIQEFITYRTDMLAAISHDLRTPLTRMRLRGEYIEDRVQRDRLFQDVQEMQTMIDGALAFFRNDGDEEAPRSFDLAEILQTIIDNFADQCIEITYTGPPHCVYSGRPIALKRAFTNLIENAVKYATPPDIELSVLGKSVSIVVRDRGPGIPVAELEKVFQPFYRLEKSRNRMSGGVGLGLTAALAVIRGHGGTLHISNRENGGLKAIVTLPLILPNLNLTNK